MVVTERRWERVGEGYSDRTRTDDELMGGRDGKEGRKGMMGWRLIIHQSNHLPPKPLLLSPSTHIYTEHHPFYSSPPTPYYTSHHPSLLPHYCNTLHLLIPLTCTTIPPPPPPPVIIRSLQPRVSHMASQNIIKIRSRIILHCPVLLSPARKKRKIITVQPATARKGKYIHNPGEKIKLQYEQLSQC